ncbi:hypothetical protein ACIRP3_36735 [Streptomyces sp. NPDC101209]|uniref:hypothetical protein n=1 Tax=Streptomyces sp. NPDC101209 TaxID=3366129 RepID=UPI00382402BC
MSRVEYETNCGGCDEPLTGRQRKWCSAACRLRQYSKAKPLQSRTCRDCGQPFIPRHWNQRRCRFGEDNERGDACFERQEAAEERAEDVNAWRDARDEGECLAPGCSAPVPYAGNGRPKFYCSARCRVRAHRAAKKGA